MTHDGVEVVHGLEVETVDVFWRIYWAAFAGTATALILIFAAIVVLDLLSH